MVEFFIRRPVFASVCSLLIVLAGAVSLPTLPVANYPEISLPQVSVNAAYVGANAANVEAAVTTPLEQVINGVQGMREIQSTSGNDGQAGVNITFDLDRNVDIAAVDVQNRMVIAQAQLPNEVKATGIQVFKSGTAFVLAIGFYTDDDRYSTLFMSNYLDVYLRDAIKRVRGVGNVVIFGERKYAMRMWLDPQRLASRQMTPQDVLLAVQEQNVQVSAGSIGSNPAPKDLAYQFNVQARGRLTTPQEFENLVVKRAPGGALVRLADVGRVELGAEDYNSSLRFNGHDAVGMGVFLLSNANGIEVADQVKRELDRASASFPAGMKYNTAFDATVPVRASIKEVIYTLLEAILLVIAVIFLFLQTWRSTLIPAITIPVSLIGTFAFVKAFGFSVNTLTLFGITLATGLVVDDAIVVIENIERFIQDKGMNARDAASAGMREVVGAVIATSLVLVAVFVPVAFFPGTTGRIYRQFSLTIAFSIAISAFNSLTLTPALSALLLKQSTHSFQWFNRAFDRLRRGYHAVLQRLMKRSGLTLGVFTLGLAATVAMFYITPSAFMPDEDQSSFIAIVQLPEGSSLQRTIDVLQQAEQVMLKQPEVATCFSVAGFSFGGNSPSRGIMFVDLIGWEKRKASTNAVIDRLRGELAEIAGGNVFPFAPPAIEGIGQFGGFSFILEDQAGGGVPALEKALALLMEEAGKRPEITGLYSGFTANDPQLVVEVDREKTKALDLSIDEVYRSLQILLGSAYVNDFNFNDRTYRVYIQADAAYRDNPRDLESYYVRTRRGQMVPLGAVARFKNTTGPQTVSHFNLYRSAELTGSAAPGFSSGQAIKAMEESARRVLPAGFGFEWTGLAREQIESGGQTVWIFVLGLLIVFLVLAAQYESLSLPFIVLFAVPLAIFGALIAIWLRGYANDVFSQIGLVMLIGLSSKNAILIVEFASQLRAQGRSITDAAVEAAETRLRPIIMTSLAFLLGVLPLVIASGAGSASRRSLGTAVFGGMIVSTVLNLAVIPVLYVVVERLRERKS